MYVITYVCNLKNKTKEYNKASTYSQILENKLVVTSGEKEGREEEQYRSRGLRSTSYYVYNKL